NKDWDPSAKRKLTIRGESYGDGKSRGFSGDLRIKYLVTSSKVFQWKRVWNGDTIGFFRKWLSFRSSERMWNPENQAQELRGMSSVILKTRSLPSIIESRNLIVRHDNDKRETWLLDMIFFGILRCQNRFLDYWLKIYRINHGRFAINVLGFWRDELTYEYHYIRNWYLLFIFITVSFIILYELNCSLFLLLALVIMTQAQLVGKGGDGKNGEGNRKRFKISIPHFDNSDLIKSYSKTLNGKCMNSAEQDVKEVHYEGKEVLCVGTERSHVKKEKSGVMGVIWGGCNNKWRRVTSHAQVTSQLPGDLDQVTLIPGELENGLDLVSEFLEDGTNTLEQDKINEDLDSSREEGMELGETDHTTTETDAGLELADEFQNLTDGEGKDMDQVEAKEFVEEDMTSGIAEGMVTAAAEKMPGLRKPLFSVAGGNNSKFVQFLMSPRKRAPAKQSLCKGGGAKQVEEKGSSHPKQLPKP
ncbi:hypothetical protein HID58_042711, partial [Brassica napus]